MPRYPAISRHPRRDYQRLVISCLYQFRREAVYEDRKEAMVG